MDASKNSTLDLYGIVDSIHSVYDESGNETIIVCLNAQTTGEAIALIRFRGEDIPEAECLKEGEKVLVSYVYGGWHVYDYDVKELSTL